MMSKEGAFKNRGLSAKKGLLLFSGLSVCMGSKLAVQAVMVSVNRRITIRGGWRFILMEGIKLGVG